MGLILSFLLGFFGTLNDFRIADLKPTNSPNEKAPKKALEPNEKFASRPTGSPQAEACLPAARTDMPCLPFSTIDKLMDAEPDPPPSNVSKEAQS